MPPSASASAIPNQPWSARAFHRPSSKGRPDCEVRPHLVVTGAVVEQVAGRFLEGHLVR